MTDSAAQSTRVKKGGLSIGGGGLFLGVAKNRNDVTTATTTNVGSLIGSTAGDVTLDAGRALSVTGSRVVGTGTTSLTGESVAITNATDVATTDTLNKSSSVGISVGVNSPVLAGVQGVRDTANIIDNRNANDRTVAVAGLAGGLAAYNGVDALKLGGPNLAKNIGDTGSLSVTFGMSKSKATSNTRDETTAGSYIAGNDVSVTARGAGPNSTILVQGSEIAAARDATLSAPGAITLRSATETDTLAQANKSSGFSAGVQIGLSGGVSPIGSLNLGKGSASGSDVQYAESVVSAGRDLTIRTGDTLTLQGALARGERVAIDAGNLAIITQQDTASYRERQRDINLSAGAGRIAGNLTSSRQQGDYASVREQSGIFAGSGGYDIAVAGDTRLVGGVIASDAAVAANRLRTGTLSATDLANRERYSASSLSVGGGLGGIGKNSDGRATVDGANPVAGIRTGLGTLSATPPVALGAKGSQSGTTYSAIAQGTIDITSGDPASLATAGTIRRDPATVNAGAIIREYNADKREEIALGFAAATQLSNQTGTFFANRGREEQQTRAAAEAAAKRGDYVTADRLFKEVDRLQATWGAGSPTRIIATAMNGAAGNGVTSGLGDLARGIAVNVVQSLAVTEVKRIADAIEGSATERESARAALQAIVGCAGSTANGSNCGAGATGAAASVLLNNLLRGQDGPSRDLNGDGRLDNADLEAQQGRANLVATIATAINATLGNSDLNSASTAASIETENNKSIPNIVRTGPSGISYAEFKSGHRDNWQKAIAIFGNDEAGLIAYLSLPNDSRIPIEKAAAEHRKKVIADAALGDPAKAAEYGVAVRTGKTDLGTLSEMTQTRRANTMSALSGASPSAFGRLSAETRNMLADAFAKLPQGEKAAYRANALRYAELSTEPLSEAEIRLGLQLFSGLPSSAVANLTGAQLAAEYGPQIRQIATKTGRSPVNAIALLAGAGVAVYLARPDGDLVSPTTGTPSNLPGGSNDPEDPNRPKIPLPPPPLPDLDRQNPDGSPYQPGDEYREFQVGNNDDGEAIYADQSGNKFIKEPDTGRRIAVSEAGNRLPRNAERQRVYDLGYDPASKKYNPMEAEAALRLEAKLGVTLARDVSGSGDWHDPQGTLYDAVGPLPKPQHLKVDLFVKSVKSHLLKSGSITVVDLTGIDSSGVAEITNRIDKLSPEENSRIIRIGF